MVRSHGKAAYMRSEPTSKIAVGQAPPAYAKAVSAWFDERRGLALGIAMAGIGIGATLVPQFARLMIDAYGWRAAYISRI